MQGRGGGLKTDTGEDGYDDAAASSLPQPHRHDHRHVAASSVTVSVATAETVHL